VTILTLNQDVVKLAKEKKKSLNPSFLNQAVAVAVDLPVDPVTKTKPKLKPKQEKQDEQPELGGLRELEEQVQKQEKREKREKQEKQGEPEGQIHKLGELGEQKQKLKQQQKVPVWTTPTNTEVFTATPRHLVATVG